MSDATHASSSPRRIRQHNSIAALQALFDFGKLSRAELGRKLGLNRSSSGHIISELLASSLVREVSDTSPLAPGKSRAGRPGILLELEPQAAYFIGVEIGVEHITTLSIDLRANIVERCIEPFDGKTTPPEDAVSQAITQALNNHPQGHIDRIKGLGLSAPAQIDGAGQLGLAPLLGWQNINLAKLAQDSLPIDIPVMIENEANAFAYGESYKKPNAKSGVTLFLVMNTGVGGGIVIDGKLLRGSHGLAGEIGHLNNSDGSEIEQLLGLEHLLRKHSERCSPSENTLEILLKDVENRSPKAVEIAEDWAKSLATAVVAASRVIDPDRVVLGGSVAALYPLVEARVLHHVKAIQAASFPLPKIEVHEEAETGAAYGAACILHRRFLSLENFPCNDATGALEPAKNPRNE